jgi:hypothetical protein
VARGCQSWLGYCGGSNQRMSSGFQLAPPSQAAAGVLDPFIWLHTVLQFGNIKPLFICMKTSSTSTQNFFRRALKSNHMILHHDTALKFEQAHLFTVIRRSGSTAQGYFYAPNGSSQVIPPSERPNGSTYLLLGPLKSPVRS